MTNERAEYEATFLPVANLYSPKWVQEVNELWAYWEGLGIVEPLEVEDRKPSNDEQRAARHQRYLRNKAKKHAQGL